MSLIFFAFQDGTEVAVKDVLPGDSVHSLLSILDIITVSEFISHSFLLSVAVCSLLRVKEFIDVFFFGFSSSPSVQIFLIEFSSRNVFSYLSKLGTLNELEMDVHEELDFH